MNNCVIEKVSLPHNRSCTGDGTLSQHYLSLAKLAFIQLSVCACNRYLLKLLRCKVPDSSLLLHTKKLPHILKLEVIEP